MKVIGFHVVVGVVLSVVFPALGQQLEVETPRNSDRRTPDGETIEQWMDVLKRDDVEAHLRAATALIQIGKPAYAILGDAFSNPYEPIWQHAVDAFVKIGEPAVPALLATIYLEQSGDLRHNGGVAAIQQMGEVAHPALKRALRDEDQHVRFAAITALRMQVMGPAQDATISILDDVLRSHDDVAIRMYAAEAIGYAGLSSPAPRAGIAALTRAMEDLDDDVKGMAAVSLVRLDAWQRKDVVSALIKALNSDKEMLPYFAVEALERLGPAGEPAIRPLVEALGHEDSFVAGGAAEALGKIGAAAIPALLEALNSPDPSVQAYATRALGSASGGSLAVMPRLLAALKHGEAEIRIAAARALGRTDESAEAVDALVDALSDSDSHVRLAAVWALGRIGSTAQPAVPALVELIDMVESYDRAAIYRTFGDIGPNAKDAIPALEAALPESPFEAGKALGRIGSSAVSTLIHALKHDDANVRTWSAFALRGIGPDAMDAVPALIEVVEQDDEVRNPAIQALGAIGPEAAPAVPTLVMVLAEGDESLHYRALRALRQIGPGAKAAKATLLSAIQTDDRERRWEAAMALFAIGEVLEGMPVVLNALEGDNGYYNLAATKALIEAGQAARAAMPVLAKVMNDPDVEFYHRIHCAKALTVLAPDDKRGVAFLRSQLVEPQSAPALNAAVALVELGKIDESVVKMLQAGMRSEHPLFAVASAAALAKVDAEREPAAEFLRGELRAEDNRTRVAAALALTEAGIVEPEAISLLAVELRLEDGTGRQIEAVSALAAVASVNERARSILTETLHHEMDAVRQAGRNALAGNQE